MIIKNHKNNYFLITIINKKTYLEILKQINSIHLIKN